MAKIKEYPSSTSEQDEKFLALIANCGVCFYKQLLKKNSWDYDEWASKNKQETLNLEHYLYVYWCSGGTTGGSCWDDGTKDNHYSMRGEDEPEFLDLDAILTVVCPNLTFLQYKKLVAGDLITRGSYSQGEYYGNSTDYTYKAIKLRDLLNKLVEMELFQ